MRGWPTSPTGYRTPLLFGAAQVAGLSGVRRFWNGRELHRSLLAPHLVAVGATDVFICPRDVACYGARLQPGEKGGGHGRGVEEVASGPSHRGRATAGGRGGAAPVSEVGGAWTTHNGRCT